MKVCPVCKTTYNDALRFCTKDGTPLALFEQKNKTSFVPDSAHDNASRASDARDVDSNIDKSFDLAGNKAPNEPFIVSIPPPQPKFEQTAPPSPSAVVTSQPPQPASRKSSNSLLIALGILFGLGALGALAAGLWVFSPNRTEIAASNNNLNDNAPLITTNQNLSNNENSAANFNINANADLTTDLNANIETNLNANLKPASTPRPSPSATPADRNTNRNTNRTIEISRANTANTATLPPAATRPTPEPTPNQAQRRTIVTSGGVVNGKATSLPKPAYPPVARSARATGQVQVVVLINENGNVESARAVSGSPLLRQAAESAARQARFSPTILSGQPVKVSGVIVYNFVL